MFNVCAFQMSILMVRWRANKKNLQMNDLRFTWSVCDRYRRDIYLFYCYFASLDSVEGLSEMDTFMSITIILITNSSFLEMRFNSATHREWECVLIQVSSV